MTQVAKLLVPSRQMWVATPIRVESGDRLVFQAEGTWVDAVIPCSADGYKAAAFYALNLLPRIPDQGRYFRLMGRIANDEGFPSGDDVGATFPIGSCAECITQERGRLFVFANDRAGFYWNNWGAVTLSITNVADRR